MKYINFFKLLLSGLILFSTVAYSETETTTHYYLGTGVPFYNNNELLSESAISINKLALYGLRYWDGEPKSTRWYSVVYRTVRMLGVDFPVSLYAAEIPHEYLGHAFPVLNYGGKIDKVTIDFPPLPYNLNYASSTSTSGENVPADISEEWHSHKKTNGLQIESSISLLIKNKFWEQEAVDYDSAILLLKTTYAPMWYAIFFAPDSSDIGNINSGNDVAAIAARYSLWSGRNYKHSQFRNRALLYNSLNPIVLWTWYSIYRYAATGQPKTELPYFSVWGIKWLPGLSYYLTVYGEEYLLSNYYQTPDGKHGSLDLGFGSVKNHFRISLLMDNILSILNPAYELGAELHFWKQNKSGVAAFAKLNYYAFGSDSSAILLKTGYKSFGFLRGYGLKKGMDVSLGYMFRM